MLCVEFQCLRIFILGPSSCSRKNLIWPLGSMHIFIPSRWLILFSPDHFSGQHPIGESPPNTRSSSELFKKDRRLTVRSSIAATSTQWGKPANLWTPCVYSLWPRVPSWIWIRWIQSASHGNTLSRLQLWLCRLRRKIPLRQPAISSLGNIFLRHSRFSPQTTRTTHSWATTSFLSLTSKHDLCYTYGDNTPLTHSTMP